MKELEIKRLLIQELANQEGVTALASEFVFDFGRRRADMISIANEFSVGYEIKSYFDKLTNLAAQLHSYLMIFDYVYVVCDKRHLEKVREIAPKKVGLYLARGNELVLKRKAKLNKKLDILVLLDAFPLPVLQAAFSMRARSKLDLCHKIISCNSLSSVRGKLISYISDKYFEQTRFFHEDAGDLVTLDDVYSLFSTAPQVLE